MVKSVVTITCDECFNDTTDSKEIGSWFALHITECDHPRKVGRPFLDINVHQFDPIDIEQFSNYKAHACCVNCLSRLLTSGVNGILDLVKKKGKKK